MAVRSSAAAVTLQPQPLSITIGSAGAEVAVLPPAPLLVVPLDEVDDEVELEVEVELPLDELLDEEDPSTHCSNCLHTDSGGQSPPPWQLPLTSYIVSPG